MNISKYCIVNDSDIEETPAFQLSWNFDDAGLVDSLKIAGQISPLVLWPGNESLYLLCGCRRRAAMRKIGLTRFKAFILPEGVHEKEALIIAVEDNLGRPLNDAEKTLIIGCLVRQMEPAEILDRYMKRLGLPARKTFLNRYISLNRLNESEMNALAAGDLDPETAEILLGLPEEDKNAVIELFDQLKPGRNKRRLLITWLEEIGRREKISIKDVLASPAITEALGAEKLNRPMKENAVRDLVRRRRYPELTRLEDEKAVLLKNLNLPFSVKLAIPDNFEGLNCRLEFDFTNMNTLADGADVIARLAEDPDMAALLELG